MILVSFSSMTIKNYNNIYTFPKFLPSNKYLINNATLSRQRVKPKLNRIRVKYWLRETQRAKLDLNHMWVQTANSPSRTTSCLSISFFLSSFSLLSSSVFNSKREFSFLSSSSCLAFDSSSSCFFLSSPKCCSISLVNLMKSVNAGI